MNTAIRCVSEIIGFVLSANTTQERNKAPLHKLRKGLRLIAAALFFLGIGVPGARGQLSFSPAQIFTNREARVSLTVPAGTLAQIDASTNLIDWDVFLTVGSG